MHPLRFPNSGIRAKVFMRKIGFKLRVMRLNRVESFYAFIVRTTRRRGGQPWPAPMQGRLQGAADCDQGSLPQVATTRYKAARGSLAARDARAAACKGDRWQERSLAGATPIARRRRPPTRCRLRAVAPAEGAVAHADGVQHRHLRRGNGSGGAEGGKERARASF
ncbi:hypothetical protein GW17_00056523 [Ensete ventricosum]|nr:hypothetical protein GW17_00056523 [Ensete ventricosum]